ncbi:hypothetical protein BJP27_07100 [Pseudomonas oryzihabitans]|nr:hypothetical protein BJP27_07100 [Pseudomonas psychrotolerans]
MANDDRARAGLAQGKASPVAETTMLIDHLDHLVLTTVDLAACENCYPQVLGEVVQRWLDNLLLALFSAGGVTTPRHSFAMKRDG